MAVCGLKSKRDENAPRWYGRFLLPGYLHVKVTL